MIRNRFTPLRLGGALLLSAALFACDGATVVSPNDGPNAGRDVGPMQTPVTIHAVFSGPPNRDPNQISLNDPSVFVQILNVEQYLGRRAQPSAVRIGPSWETGTPAQDFTVLDINNDGNRDIQLRFNTQALVNAGHLGPNTTQITVWGRDATTGQNFTGTAQVQIIGQPPAGMEDLVVVADGNFFFDIALDHPDAQNTQFVRNVVNFENQGPRSDGTVVWWDRGRNSATTTTPVRAQQVIANEGFTVEVIQSTVGDRFLDIPANVRSIWLWTPRVEYTNAEINALKQFIVEGGRIMFIGESAGFLGAAGQAAMNGFLERMGVEMRLIPGTSHVGYVTSTNIVPHPLTAGIQALRWAGGGVLSAGPETDPMFYDATGALLVGATEPIDPTPVTGREVFAPRPMIPVDPSAPATETGQ
jgi:hypothetical protein